uniref:C2H2-type domain-containing protein n=1 Tax=Coturnix japonica TaxID=93934 RepID=A0A8C2TMQ9_COTJA
MNLEQERPFVCSAPGCSQRFPTEDHLMIHRHKHEMTLKFPSIKTDNMLSDQTPTPTRFLKNCEEVGLFNDIDCSLEHEFRKAQEEENNKRVYTVWSLKAILLSLFQALSGWRYSSWIRCKAEEYEVI